ncbi:MAG: GDSL-type esterase/lipase family protein [Chitinophagales bacterium]
MKRVLAAVGLCCVMHGMHAQTLSYIQTDSSRIEYPGDSSTMMYFFDLIDKMQSGEMQKIRVAHFGGSHIQAGYWTEALADSFQALGGYTGGGAFLFPYRVVKTNGPPFYRTHGDGTWKRCRAVPSEMCKGLGLCGMGAVTTDTVASFGFVLRPNAHISAFNDIRVYHNFNPSYYFQLPASFPATYRRMEFPEGGYTEFIFDQPIDTIHFDLHKTAMDNSEFFLRGWSIENNDPGFYFASLGVNGASTYSFLQCTEFNKELATLPPDLVIFSIGVNDSQDDNFQAAGFNARYDSLCANIRAVNPHCAILFCTITDNYIRRKYKNKRSLDVNAEIYKVAEKYGAGVWDLYTVMGGYGSIDKWYRSGLASSDRIHFKSEGYYMVAGMMFSAWHKSYLYHSAQKN